MINAGRLDKRLELQEPVVLRGLSGEDRVQWTTRATVWAAIEPVRGREYVVQDQVRSDIDTMIRIRASSQTSALTAAWRGLHGSKVYNFAAAADVMTRGVYLEIPARSGANNG